MCDLLKLVNEERLDPLTRVGARPHEWVNVALSERFDNALRRNSPGVSARVYSALAIVTCLDLMHPLVPRNAHRCGEAFDDC